jgi:uncharacterized membrane protein YebE (DUF533 family)
VDGETPLAGATALGTLLKPKRQILRKESHMRRTMLTISLLAAGTSIAAAQTNTPGIDARQANQEQRIQQGVASGQLNAKETYRLEKGQARINQMETNAKADGVVTKGERARIQGAQDVQSQRIYNQKHDAQTAGGVAPAKPGTSPGQSAANASAIDNRQSNQSARIQQGVGSGQLNAKETYQLEKGQARVSNMENRAKADGVVTNGERARINQAQNVQSRRIYNKKHN